MFEFFIFSSVILKKRLKKILWRGVFRFLPVALLASAADAALLWGVRSFMGILQGEAFFSLVLWLVLMVVLTALRFAFFAWKMNISEKWLFGAGSLVMAWFLHTLRSLSPRVFHTPEGEMKVEAAYESAVVLQSNGGVFFQAVQAVLQLLVFLPVLFYISWPLTLFLFVVVVPLVSWMQRSLHKMGPAEENILTERSNFRNSLYLARKLFRRWSSGFERSDVSNDLMSQVRVLRDDGVAVSLRKGVLSLVAESVSVLAMVFVLAFCALLISKGWMDGTGLVLYCSAVLLCYKPVKECARVMPQARSAMSALRVLEKFEALPSKKSDSSSVEKRFSSDLDCLEIKHGDFSYEGAFATLFSNFSLCWQTKKPVLVRGRNGVGKSTLLRLIAGLDPVQDGKIVLDGEPVQGPDSKRGYVFQQGCLFPWLTVEDNIAMGLKIRGVYKQNKDKVHEFIEKIGLAGFEKNFPHQISGGMAQRVAIARALINDPEILLLDEPMGALDSFTRADIQNLLLELRKERNTTMILVTHDIDEALYLSDRIVIMTPRPGRISEVLEIHDSFPRERGSALFLEKRRKILERFDLARINPAPEYMI